MDSGVILTLWIAVAIVIGGGGFLYWETRPADWRVLSQRQRAVKPVGRWCVAEMGDAPDRLFYEAAGWPWAYLYSDGTVEAVSAPRRSTGGRKPAGP